MSARFTTRTAYYKSHQIGVELLFFFGGGRDNSPYENMAFSTYVCCAFYVVKNNFKASRM